MVLRQPPILTLHYNPLRTGAEALRVVQIAEVKYFCELLA